MIDPANHPSRKVAGKLGFTFWKQSVIAGWVTDVLRIRIGEAPVDG